MEPVVLTDKSIKPTDDIVFSIIGDKKELWLQILDYMVAHHKDISEQWNFYNDGKCWMFRIMKKKKTILWIGVLKDTFRVGFWFGNKAEPIILKSDISKKSKDYYKNTKQTKIGKGIAIVMADAADVEDVKKLIELKLKMK
jgi:hypothetical protein